MKNKKLVNIIALENEIAKDYGIKEGYLFVDLPEMKLSEFKVLIKQNGKLIRIDEISSLARALEKVELERPVFCLYTSPEYITKLKDFDPKEYFEYKPDLTR